MNQGIRKAINQLLVENVPFVSFRYPGSNTIHLSNITGALPFNINLFNNTINIDGFVMYPFDDQNESGWIFECSEKKSFLPEPHTPFNQINNTTESIISENLELYSEQFQKMSNALRNGEVQKVILSRIVKLNKNLINDIPEIFARLCDNHPEAFVYLISTSQTGIWTGASPELLISETDNVCTTVALAGTRENSPHHEQWTEKELEEQGMVSNFIDKLLHEYNVEKYQKQGPVITKAGTVTHLKTSYSFDAKQIAGKTGSFINALHPTPALCGYPKDDAMKIIRQTEKHNRSYYGGFLGPVNHAGMHLYVNIRCMKINNESSSVFVGGGLTLQSELQSEWRETHLKSQTLLSVINNI